MAKKIDKFLNFLKLTDEDDYDDDLYNNYDEESEKELIKEDKRVQKEQLREERRNITPPNDYDDYDDIPIIPKKTAPKTASSKVVPIHAASTGGLEVCIIKPANFGESQQVCDILLSGQPVVVNLEGMDILEAQRIMDFISGCIFSITGNMKQVSRYIFIFSPKNVDISGDYIQNITEGGEGINIPTINKEF